MTHVWITRFLPALFVLIFFFNFIYNCICTCYYNVNFLDILLRVFFFYVYDNNRFFFSIVEFSTGRYICICNGCDPPPVSFILYMTSHFILWTPCCHGFYKSQILREKKKYFLSEKVVLKYLNTSLCCKIIITF